MTENELCNIVPHHDGWIIGDDPATRKVFEAGQKGKLRAAVKWGIGADNVDFNAANLASGIYLYRIQSGDFIAVKKMMLIK